MRTNYTWWRWY